MDNTYFDTNIKKDCNGCGTCALVCPKKCIKMEVDAGGFLYPVIDKSKCINCGKCRNLCSNCNEKNEKNEKAYLGINKSMEELAISSSGGIFFPLVKYVLKNQGIVFGVIYNNELEVVHTYADNLEDCKKFCGSKYVRSDLGDSYIKVKEFLDKGKLVLFTGTTCQISGLKKYLNKDYNNLILCDVLCHANPSPKVFKLYVKNLENIKKKKVKNIHFRSKENGWDNVIPIIEYEDGEKEEENSYFEAFVKELINRPSCYACKFASKRRITDFTIADFWGIEKIEPSVNIKNGVSLFTVNSEKGKEILEYFKDDIMMKEVDYNKVENHYHNVKIHEQSQKFFQKLEAGKLDENNIIRALKKYTKHTLFFRIKRKLKNIISK